MKNKISNMGVHLIEGEIQDIDINNGRISGIKVLNGLMFTTAVFCSRWRSDLPLLENEKEFFFTICTGSSLICGELIQISLRCK